jgi:hypothetical protein
MDAVDCRVEVHYEGKANNEEKIVLSTRFCRDEPVEALVEQDQDATENQPADSSPEGALFPILGSKWIHPVSAVIGVCMAT